MKYEVSIFLKESCIVSWRFKSLMQAVKYCDDVDMSLVDVVFIRLRDHKEFNVNELLDLYRCF